MPAPPAALSVQAVPPLTIRRLHLPPARTKATAVSSQAPRPTYVPRPSTVVKVSPARKLLKAHRSAVISKLAPTAPLVRARVLAAVTAPRHLAKAKPAAPHAKTFAALAAALGKKKQASPNAKPIAALALGLGKK